MITKDNEQFLARFGSADVAQQIYDTDDYGRHRGTVIKNPALRDAQIDHFIDHLDEIPMHNQIAYNYGLKQHHIEKLLEFDDEGLNYILAQNPKLPIHHIDRFVESNEEFMHCAVARNPKLEPHHIDRLIDHADLNVRYDLASHKNLQPNHIDKLISNYEDDPQSVLKMSRYQKFSPDQIDQALEKSKSDDF